MQKSPTTAATSTEARNRSNPSATVDLKRVGLSLTLVLGVILVARFAMKKLFPAVSVGRKSQIIRVVSRSVIGPKQQFLLVKIGKRLVLVGDSGASMNPLAEITDPDEVAELVGQLQSESNHSSVGAFASMFRKAETQFQAEDDEALASAPATTSQAVRRELLADEVAPEPDEQSPPDRKLVAAASEINGLMDRVRLLANRSRGS
ncbi:MAG: flagellar biosynthetic protein FliO [Anaerolineae bacterium]|nr:flagellar biosynthetic protein FliO [Phycisphaerae bacterium]